MLFIETDSPPPFYQPSLTPERRQQLDEWFIGKRSQTYYVKRFAQFDKQGYLSPKWHWAAFFMTFPWLLYRKRYMDAIVYSVAGWSFIQLNITIILVVFETLAMSYVPEGHHMLTRIVIGAGVWLFWSVMVARWSDAYYYRMARREIADALEMFPRDQAAQQAHLRHEGGVSMVGLALGFGFFVFMLLLINTQFLPLYAKPKEQAVLYEVYNIAQGAKNRVEVIYQQTGKCPVDLPLTTAEQKVRLAVYTHMEWVPNSPCMVVATVQNVPFPNRYLNGQTLVLYRSSTPVTATAEPLGQAVAASQQQASQQQVRWGCMSSLNKKQTPKRCLAN